MSEPTTADVLTDLERTLYSRLVEAPEGSYSVTLLRDNELARRKIAEEAFEVTLELGREPVDKSRTAEEAADLVFHLLAGLVGAGVPWDDVLEVLEHRRG
ncbi:MAG: phosphoribosyl-ATP diphosphatase [Actinomycetota bacterium]|nr:phosphoribosyl-ATP diphosphatase [Actinomycetota bacterium]